MKAHLAAYKGNFDEMAETLKKGGMDSIAGKIFMQMKMFKKAKEYINKYVKDETYRKDKTKEPSLLKVLKGSTDEKYDYAFRTKRRNNPQSIKLVLDDGQFWRRNEKVPDEVYETCLTK